MQFLNKLEDLKGKVILDAFNNYDEYWCIVVQRQDTQEIECLVLETKIPYYDGSPEIRTCKTGSIYELKSMFPEEKCFKWFFTEEEWNIFIENKKKQDEERTLKIKRNQLAQLKRELGEV